MKAASPLAKRLAGQPALFGLLQTIPSSTVAEIASLTGYDFLVLDCEHGLFSDRDILEALRAASASRVAVLVRLRGHDLGAIGRFLDMGAHGVLAPNVATADQARALVAAMRYPPAGTRGFAAPTQRITGYGRDLASHLAAPHENAFLAVLIESAEGVANVDAILAVDGVDAAIIGPSDLSANLGRVTDFTQSFFQAALTRCEQAAVERGKLLGMPPLPGYDIATLHNRGHRLFIIGADAPLIRDAMSTQVSSAIKALEEEVGDAGVSGGRSP